MKEEVSFPRPLVNKILHQAQISPENEICGFIGARQGVPVSCYPVHNVAKQTALRFWMDPKQQIDAMREMREKNEDLFAIYHSHPSAPAELSATDLEQANYPDTLQIVISLNTKGVLEMRGFRLRDGNHVEEIILGLCDNELEAKN